MLEAEGLEAGEGAAAGTGGGGDGEGDILLLNEDDEARLMGDLPESLADLQDAAFPLVITYKKFIDMLDATLTKPFIPPPSDAAARLAPGAPARMLEQDGEEGPVEEDPLPGMMGRGSGSGDDAEDGDEGGTGEREDEFDEDDEDLDLGPGLPDELPEEASGRAVDADGAGVPGAGAGRRPRGAPRAAQGAEGGVGAAGGAEGLRGGLEGGSGRGGKWAGEVDFERFEAVYWNHLDASLTKKMDASLVFKEIMSYIKGSIEALRTPKGRLTQAQYLGLASTRYSAFDTPQREAIYRLYVQYEKRKLQRKEYDAGDRVFHIYSEIKKGQSTIHRPAAQQLGAEAARSALEALTNASHPEAGKPADATAPFQYISVDEVQDLTQAQIAVLRFVCSNVESGFVFAGDTAQTIARGVDFRFQDIRRLYYEEFLGRTADTSTSSSSSGPKAQGGGRGARAVRGWGLREGGGLPWVCQTCSSCRRTSARTTASCAWPTAWSRCCCTSSPRPSTGWTRSTRWCRGRPPSS